MKKTITLLAIAVLVSPFWGDGRGVAQTINTIAGTGVQGFSGDGGAATAAQLYYPWGVAIDGTGNVYIADNANNRIRKVNTAGVISTFAGIGGIPGFSGDGGAAIGAQLNNPIGVGVDGIGNVYIVDRSNQRIRKVNTSGVISTFAGIGGTPGFSGDGGAATTAQLNLPAGVAVDAAGNMYIADQNNYRIRKVNMAGIISTFAGTGTAGFSGDGGAATAAQLNQPTGVAVDAAGNVYIADQNNYRIRKVNTAGIISTFAGIGTLGFSGDSAAATAAQLNYPWGVAVDAAGNVYIADVTNDRIRKVNTAGVISTFAGGGFVLGDGGVATAARLNNPRGVAVDGTGNVYIADLSNHRIRKVTLSTAVKQFAINDNAYAIYPNPGNGIMNLELRMQNGIQNTSYDFRVTDILGEEVIGTSHLLTPTSQIDVSNLQNGIYFVSVKTNEGVLTKKIIVQH